MRLLELFDTSGKWKWVGHSDAGGGADITVGEHRYYVTMEEEDIEYLEKMHQKAGGGDTPEWLKMLVDDYSASVFSVEFEFEDRGGESKADSKYGLTGTGNQYKVFTTVMEVMKDFRQRYDVDYWHFTADNPSRRKLYDRMADRLSRGHFVIDIGEERHYVVQA